jgi:spoIIIJ-associated protein
MTFREFTGKNVEEAIRAAMAEYSAGLGDLDIEILAQGSRGILGVGGEDARILAAPKSAIAAADSVRAEPVEQPDAAPSASRGGRGARGGAEGRTRRRSPTDGPPAESVESVPASAEEQDAMPDAVETAAAAIPVDVADADTALADEAPPRSDGERRARGGRGRGGRGRNGRDREGRADRTPREPREPRADRGREPAPFVSGKPVEELSDEERSTLETAKTVLTEMLSLMGINGTVEVATGGDTARLNVKGDDLGLLIGRRGEKLASLQHIVNLIAGKREGQHHRIAVDVENYRGRREEQLRDVAERAAKRVSQTGKIIQLEAMPAVERRIVHMALLENSKVRTQSVGVEPNRRIVVLPASQVKG